MSAGRPGSWDVGASCLLAVSLGTSFGGKELRARTRGADPSPHDGARLVLQRCRSARGAATLDRPVALTSAGRAQLRALNSAMQSLASRGSLSTMASGADGIVAKVVATLNSNVVPSAHQPAGTAASLAVPASVNVTVHVFRQYHVAH